MSLVALRLILTLNILKMIKKTRMLALVSLGMLSVFSCDDSEELVNREPSVPGVILPIDEAKDVAKDIELKWKASIDPEKAEVKYDVYLGTKAELTTEDIKSKAQVETYYKTALSGHSTYFWKLVATDGDGVSSETAVFTFETENSIPNKSLAEFPADKAEDIEKSMTFKWSASDDSDNDVITYSLYLAKKDVFTDEDIVGSELTSNEFKVEKLEENIQYFWKVVTKDSEGANVESDVFSFTTLNLAPNAVVGLFPEHEATGVEQTITFNWSESVDENGVKYFLYLAKKNSFSEEDIVGKDLEVVEYEVKDLDPNTQYFWKVVTKDPAGLSVDSEVYSFTTLNGLPGKVTAGFPENEAKEVAKAITFKWSESVDDDVVKYNLFLAKKNTFTDDDIVGKNLEKNEFKTDALEGHTQYFWKVSTMDAQGASVESDVYSFTTINSIPSVAKAISPENNATIESENAICQWTASVDDDKDVLKYDFYFSENNSFTVADIKGSNLSETQIEVKSLKNKTQYFWKVVTKDSEDASVESDVFSFTTDYTPPIVITIAEPTQIIYEENLYVNVSWTVNNEAPALTYDIYVSEDATFTADDLKLSNLDVSTLKSEDWEGMLAQVPGLDFERDYKMKIVAKDAQGVSTSSDIYDLRTIAFKSEASEKPKHIKPADNFDGIPTEFEWTAVGKGVKYDLIISTHYNLSDPIFEKKDMLETSITVDLSAVAVGDVKYYWSVTAKGERGDDKMSLKTSFLKNLPLTFEMGTFTDTRDSHEYKTVTFKGKTWLAENFAYLPGFVDENDDEKKCSVYGLPIVKPMFGGAGWTMPTIEEAKAHENFAKYGVMYTAYFLDDIAPEGWHVATDDEWKELEEYTGMSESEVDGTSYRGNTVHKLLSTTSTWTSNPAPTNEFKLDIKPGGYNKVMEDSGENKYTYFWTYPEVNQYTHRKTYFNRALSGSKPGINRGNTKSPTYRMYVRLVKDSE